MKNLNFHHLFIFKYFSMIEVHGRPKQVFFKNLFRFFVLDEPKLRNHGYQKWDGPLRVAVSPLDVIKKKKIWYTLERLLLYVKNTELFNKI